MCHVRSVEYLAFRDTDLFTGFSRATLNYAAAGDKMYSGFFSGSPETLGEDSKKAMLGYKTSIGRNSHYLVSGNRCEIDSDGSVVLEIPVDSRMLSGLHDLSVVTDIWKKTRQTTGDTYKNAADIGIFRNIPFTIYAPELTDRYPFIKKHAVTDTLHRMGITANIGYKYGLTYLDNIKMHEVNDNKKYYLYFDRSVLAEMPDNELVSAFDSINSTIKNFHPEGSTEVTHYGTPGHYRVYSTLMEYFRNRWRILACDITGAPIEEVSNLIDSRIINVPEVYNLFYGRGYDDYAYLGSAILNGLEKKFISLISDLGYWCGQGYGYGIATHFFPSHFRYEWK